MGAITRMTVPTGGGRGFVYEINDGGIHNELLVFSGLTETTIEYIDHGTDESITVLGIRVTRVTIPLGNGWVVVFKAGDGRIVSHVMMKSTIEEAEIEYELM